MGFTRRDMMASRLAGEMGDPFRFRMPKIGLSRRTLRGIGRVARGLGGTALGFVPGAGPAMQRFLSHPAVRAVAAQYPDEVQAWSRSFGLDMGDAPSHHGRPHGAGPRIKHTAAAAHKQNAPHPAHGHAPHTAPAHVHAKAARHAAHASPHGPGVGSHVATVLSGLASGIGPALSDTAGAAGAAGSSLLHGDIAGAFAGLGMHALGPIGGAAAAFGGRRRRRINPANVKALRGSLRRVESFQRLAASVLPKVEHTMHGRSHGKKARGHKPGCGCFACKRRSR